jgi:hypothetical protein
MLDVIAARHALLVKFGDSRGFGRSFTGSELRRGHQGDKMNSEKIAGILGAIVALAVLAAAFVYVPPGSSNAPAKQAAQPPQAPANPEPVVRGPVVREVPQ